MCMSSRLLYTILWALLSDDSISASASHPVTAIKSPAPQLCLLLRTHCSAFLFPTSLSLCVPCSTSNPQHKACPDGILNIIYFNLFPAAQHQHYDSMPEMSHISTFFFLFFFLLFLCICFLFLCCFLLLFGFFFFLRQSLSA